MPLLSISIERENGGWVGGIGDLVLGYKRNVMANSTTGSILSFQGEVNAPTGNRFHDLGTGVTIFETFAAFGQRLTDSSFIQIQTGGEFPTDTEKVPRAAFFRSAVGKTFAQNHGFGRIWTPMAEFIGIATSKQVHERIGMLFRKCKLLSTNASMSV